MVVWMVMRPTLKAIVFLVSLENRFAAEEAADDGRCGWHFAAVGLVVMSFKSRYKTLEFISPFYFPGPL